MLFLHLPILFDRQFGGLDFLDAVGQKLDLPIQILFVGRVERIDLLLDFAELFVLGPVGRPGIARLSEGVEDFKLVSGIEQRLVVVRSVHVHQHIAQPLEYLQRDGLVVHHRLGGRIGDHSPYDQQSACTGFQANVGKDGIDAHGIFETEFGIDRTGCFAGADHRFVRPLTEQKP